MTVKERIFAEARNNSILVFPTQSTADSWAASYARSNAGKPAFTDSFISWDTFRDSCRKTPSGKKEAGYVHRLVFTTEFLKSNALNALCPPSYPESKALFADEIAASLPDFRAVLDNPGNVGRDLLSDIRKIYDAYRSYLEKNNLFEKAFIKPDFSQAAAEGKTVLVFPHACNDGEVERAIEAGMKPVEPEDAEAVITVYTNTLDEIRNALNRIRSLLKEGTSVRDIKITICSTEMLPWLETEAYRRNIALDVKIGRPLAEYPAGAMFKAIENVSSGQWSVQSLQALLLNPSFPFRSRERALKLIRAGIDLKVLPSRRANSWTSKLRTDNLDYLFTLRDRLEAINGAGDVNSLREAIHAFEDEYLGEKDAMQTKVYSRCMEELEKLATACPAALPEKPFSLFVRLLSRERYMPKTEDNGVAVYLYPSNAGMTAPYHFALGFDDEKTGRERTVSMFSDAEGLQIGDEIIRSYEAGGAVFSCAKDSYTGYVTEGAYFAVNRKVNDVSEKHEISKAQDEFSFEEVLWARDLGTTGSVCSTELQKKWFESLQPGSRPENNEKYEALKPDVRISATELNTFIKCPYRWYCGSKYALGLKTPDYEADMEDSLEVGTMIHNCLEEWLEEEKDFSKLKDDGAGRKLEAIFEKHFSRYSQRAAAPYAPQLRRLALTLPESMRAFSTAKGFEKLQDFSVTETEKEFDNGVVKGRIDCVLQDKNGNIAILDFKKRKAEDDSVQLQFYSYGLDKLPVCGAFFAVGEKKYTFRWENEESLKELVTELDSELEIMRKTVESGRFESTPSEKSCEYCDFRSICRKRFVIK